MGVLGRHVLERERASERFHMLGWAAVAPKSINLNVVISM